MNKYGKAAVEAVALIHNQSVTDPEEAWNKVISGGEGCPQCAFLGLCEDGFVRGVPPGNYTASKKNKQYAIDAVTILREHPDLASDPTSLWDLVMRGESKKYHQQMDVVTALWNNKLIE